MPCHRTLVLQCGDSQHQSGFGKSLNREGPHVEVLKYPTRGSAK
jgi:hypothetical protein